MSCRLKGDLRETSSRENRNRDHYIRDWIYDFRRRFSSVQSRFTHIAAKHTKFGEEEAEETNEEKGEEFTYSCQDRNRK